MSYTQCKFCKKYKGLGGMRVLESEHVDICMCPKCSEIARKVVLEHFKTTPTC